MSNKVKGNIALALMLALIMAVTFKAADNITGGFTEFVTGFIETGSEHLSQAITSDNAADATAESPFNSTDAASIEAAALVNQKAAKGATNE